MTSKEQRADSQNVATLESEEYQGQSLWRDSFRRLFKNRMATLGLIIIILFILMATFSEQIAPKDPFDQELTDNNAAPQWVIDLFPVMIAKGQDGGYITVSEDYPIGADELGRDLLSRIIYGSRISLAVAFVGPIVALAIGLTLGLMAGYFGGRTDSFIMRIVDIFYAFPALLLIILFMAYFRGGFSEPAPPPNQYPHTLKIEGLEAGGRLSLDITHEEGKSAVSKKLTADENGVVTLTFPNININTAGVYTVNARGPKDPIGEGTFTILAPANGEEPSSELTALIDIADNAETVLVADTEEGVTITVSQAVAPSFFEQISYALADLDRGMGGMLFIFVGIGLTSWVGLARLTRGQVLSVREKEYIIAAQSLGQRKAAIIIKHVFPNILGPLIIAETLTIPSYIRYEAVLSFIGLGVNRPTPSWGSMISDGSKALSSYPYQAIFPAIALFLIMFAFNFLGDGLRDALDPRMRGSD